MDTAPSLVPPKPSILTLTLNLITGPSQCCEIFPWLVGFLGLELRKSTEIDVEAQETRPGRPETASREVPETPIVKNFGSKRPQQVVWGPENEVLENSPLWLAVIFFGYLGAPKRDQGGGARRARRYWRTRRSICRRFSVKNTFSGPPNRYFDRPEKRKKTVIFPYKAPFSTRPHPA
jgi:hypothetical protein